MRPFVIATLLLFLIAEPVAAQTQQAFGVVAVELRPNAVEVKPGATREVFGTVNATIECEPGYSPSDIEVRVDPNSLQDEQGDDVWIIDPMFADLDLVATGSNRYEAHEEIHFDVGAEEPLRDLKGRIEFDLFASNGLSAQNCALFGTTWTFETTPFIDVAMRTDEPIQQNQDVPPAAAPESTFNPADVIVEKGPVQGESYVPVEAFWSMGTVVALFSSYGVYEWRRGRNK